ncbi:hypothetical protein [Agromyces lapidis]|uniref:NIPSNAP domain-containing protein n=1 Tax=Agromyces lapidis TaxID=279574 RepID=A0ABV5SU10_9MICO|nr:hypothetical protein [Agromyces lapidis]
MKTVQLRRYQIVPGEYEAFVSWFEEKMPPVRRATGFEVEFAYGVPEANEFVWAVSVPGDRAEFERVEAAYVVSPERAAVFEGLPERIASKEISYVEGVRVG